MPVMNTNYVDDDMSNIVPDDFTTYPQLEKTGFGTTVGFDDNYDYFPEAWKMYGENFGA